MKDTRKPGNYLLPLPGSGEIERAFPVQLDCEPFCNSSHLSHENIPRFPLVLKVYWTILADYLTYRATEIPFQVGSAKLPRTRA